MLHNDYSNKGIGTEAVKQICSIAFKVLSLEQITANVFQPNIASIRVLQKNDFKYKVTIPNAIIKDGNVYDLLIYGLTKETIKHVLSE
jgi:RimJ/RimL family protein N-acetyltransferase